SGYWYLALTLRDLEERNRRPYSAGILDVAFVVPLLRWDAGRGEILAPAGGHGQALVTTPAVPQPRHGGGGTPLDTGLYGDNDRTGPDRCRVPGVRLDSRLSDRSGDAGCRDRRAGEHPGGQRSRGDVIRRSRT